MPTSESEKGAVLEAFDEGLRRIGYPAEQIKRNYGYSNFVEDGQRQTVDLAAFGGAVPSLRTCNIGVVVEGGVTSERLVRLRALGAPLLFTYDVAHRQLARWRMSADGPPIALESPHDVQPGNLPEYFAGHRTQWEPEAFRQARTATYRDEALQPDFFDVGLLPALEGQLQRKLSGRIQNIAARSREIVNEREGGNAFERQFASYARLLFRLLAARLLSDRGDLPTLTQTPDVAAVLRVVEEKYHVGETVEPALDNPLVQDQVWAALRRGLDLRNLSPETLAFVYENTLVDRDLRQRNGIHATPPHVADHLLRQLPIEQLPEAERVVFEPFCGNAPFLLAAMRRLRDLLPADRTPADVHEYLAARLLGIEILPFAREIARYSLILGDYPNANSWQIAEGNAFTDARFETYLQQATIVLSNPPHEDFPSGERPVGAHHNRAAEALRRVLQRPPRLLGFVMPLVFVDGSDYKALRRQLVEIYPNLTVTALPANVFGKASQQTALIAAHYLDGQKRYFWAAVSPQENRTTFPVTGKPALIEERTTLPTSEDGTPILWQRPQGKTAGLWKALTDFPTLKTVAELHRGLQWTKLAGEQSSTETTVSDEEKEGSAPGIHKTDSTVEHYVATRTLYLNVQPERRLWNALRWNWEQPKALVNATRTSRGIWRLVALSDTEGLYASHKSLGVWPHPTDSIPVAVEVLSALLNGPLANAFVYQRSRERDNDKNVLEKIPVPSLTHAQVEEITSLVDAYKDLRLQHIDTPQEWSGTLADQGRRALLKIDAAVLEAYALPTELETTLLRLFDGVKRGHLPFSFTGYDADEWAEVKAELADDREARRIADQFFALLRKKNLFGLTPAEQDEYDRLERLRTARRSQYRTLAEKAGRGNGHVPDVAARHDSTDEYWDRQNTRRVFLIKKELHEELVPAEQDELNRLQAEMGEYLDAAHPLPFEELERRERYVDEAERRLRSSS